MSHHFGCARAYAMPTRVVFPLTRSKLRKPLREVLTRTYASEVFTYAKLFMTRPLLKLQAEIKLSERLSWHFIWHWVRPARAHKGQIRQTNPAGRSRERWQTRYKVRIHSSYRGRECWRVMRFTSVSWRARHGVWAGGGPESRQTRHTVLVAGDEWRVGGWVGGWIGGWVGGWEGGF